MADVITFGAVAVVPPVPAAEPPVPVPALPPVPAAEPPAPPRPPVPVLPPLPVVPEVPPALPPEPVVPPVPVVPPPPMSMHAPLVQVWLVEQQAVPHAVGVAPVQLELQEVPLQTWFAPHALPQLPQLVASDGTQDPLQSSSPDWHLHMPLWQVFPAAQGMPQEPQLLLSDDTSEHWPAQSIWLARQLPLVPAVPVAPLPPVPGPPVIGLLQAAVRIAKPRPKKEARAVFITT